MTPPSAAPSQARIDLFHAGGREAEIEEVFRRILAAGAPLDQVEIACASDAHIGAGLEALLQMRPAVVVQYRPKNGSFKKFADLRTLGAFPRRQRLAAPSRKGIRRGSDLRMRRTGRQPRVARARSLATRHDPNGGPHSLPIGGERVNGSLDALGAHQELFCQFGDRDAGLLPAVRDARLRE
jgi:hypothetical protein